MTFAEYIYSKGFNPFEVAFDSSKYDKLKKEWSGNTTSKPENLDIVFEKLSKSKIVINNDKLVSVVSKMTKDDSNQTNSVGSWIYYCLKDNREKALKAKSKVSDKYQKTIEKYLDSFIKMLTT